MYVCTLQVEEQRKRDATEGHEIALKLEGKISRKVQCTSYTQHFNTIMYTLSLYNMYQVVKQTVMTVVYGVTWVGGRLQIAVSKADVITDT